MLKKIFVSVAFFNLVVVNAQNLSDYNYFHISPQTTDFSNNQYQLQSRLNYYLKKKDFNILPLDKSIWPTEASSNPCNVIEVDLEKGKSLLTNKLEIQFKDCKNNIIEKFEGKSNIKEFEKGYQEALLKALAKIGNQNYTGKNAQISSLPDLTNNEPVALNPTTSIDTTSTENPLTNGIKKVELKDGGFLLMNETNMQTIAQFEPTLTQGTYRVTVFEENGQKYSSVGSINGNTITYEVKINGQWKVKTIHF